MEDEKFWKLQELFEQYMYLENVRFDYVKGEKSQKSMNLIRKEIEQIMGE